MRVFSLAYDVNAFDAQLTLGSIGVQLEHQRCAIAKLKPSRLVNRMLMFREYILHTSHIDSNCYDSYTTIHVWHATETASRRVN